MDTINSKLHKAIMIPKGGGGRGKLIAELRGLGASPNILLALAEAEAGGWTPEYVPRSQGRASDAYRFTDTQSDSTDVGVPGALPGELYGRLTLGDLDMCGAWYTTPALAWEDLGRAIQAVYGTDQQDRPAAGGEGPVPPGEMP